MAAKKKTLSKPAEDPSSAYIDSSSEEFKAMERQLVERARGYEEAEREYARMRREFCHTDEGDTSLAHVSSSPPA